MTAAVATGCKRCGNCCRVPGYVYLLRDEPDRIAAYLGLSIYDFTGRYARLVNERSALSLKDKADGSCIFLDETGCRIQSVKPSQCSAFPHGWRFEGWREVCKGDFDI
jgi:Fe-S-cluster containining protein